MTSGQDMAPSTPTAVSDAGEMRAGARPILDLSGIDLSGRIHSRAEIERVIPHRGHMLLLDAIVWASADFTCGIGMKRVTQNEFWVPGHFPDRPLMPGVLLIEAGAQMGCYLYNRRRPDPKTVAFLRIEDAAFRSKVEPGDDLLILCKELKFGRRNFKSEIQGMVGDRICFDARITGMQM